MFNKELEQRLLNLEKQVINLAIRQSNRSIDIESAINSTNNDLATTNSNVSSVETNISNSNWNDTTFYSAEDYVMHNNILYVCLMDNVGINPSNAQYWKSANVAEELNKLKSLIAKGEN